MTSPSLKHILPKILMKFLINVRKKLILFLDIVMKDKMRKTEIKMKGINSNFDKFDKNIAKFDYKFDNLLKNYEKFKADYENEQEKKSKNDVVKEIKGFYLSFTQFIDEFEQIKSFMKFSSEETLKKVKNLQEFLCHYTPLQTHLQVCEAFEFMGCLSSDHKLKLFQVHKSRMLKLL